MPGNFWEKDAVVGQGAPAPVTSGGGVILSDPNAGLDRVATEMGIAAQRDSMARGGESLDLSRQGNDRSERQFQQQQGNQRFGNAQALRTEYQKLPAVKDYAEAVKLFGTALTTTNNAAGDLALVNAYAKVVDPGSVVRQEEGEAAANTASTLEATTAKLKKEFGIEGGGMMSDSARQNLRVELNNRLGGLNKSYVQARDQYRQLAVDNGFTADEIVGQHAGAPFKPALDRWLGVRSDHSGGSGDQYDLTPDGSAKFKTDRDKQVGAGLTAMVNEGRSLPEIDAFLVSQGYPPITGGEYEEQWKADLASGRSFAVGGGPVSGYTPPNILGSMVNSTGGAAVGGYLNGVTYGGLDEAAGMMGGDMDRVQQAKEVMSAAHPYAYGAGELAGAVTGMVGLNRVAPALQVGRAALATDAAVGAAYGGLESNDNRIAGALLGGAAGAVGNRVGSAIGGALERRAVARAAQPLPPATEGQQVFAAAERQGVAPFAADVGEAATRRNVFGLMQTPYGAGPLTRAAQRTTETFNAAKDRIATAIAPIQGREAFGNQVRAGVEAAIDRENARGNTLYGAAERAAAGAQLTPTGAIRALADNIAAIEDTGLGATGLSLLRNLQTRLQAGPVSVETGRAMRTRLREDFASSDLRGTDMERRGLQVMDALTQDIDDGLRAQGMDRAADLYVQANAQWAAYTSFVDDVAAPIIGKDGVKAAEEVVSALGRDLKGNNARAARLLNALPAADQSAVRANIIGGLGRAPAGAQDATNQVHTMARFLTNWNEIGEPAKAAFFGPELRSALNDLATVASGSKQAGKYAGFSNTGAVNAANATNTGLMGATGALLTGHPLVAAALASPVLAQAGGSRMMASPRFVRWLARGATRPNPAAQRAHIAQLTTIAKVEPILAGDIASLQSYLTSAFASAPYKAAAGEQVKNGRQEPPQNGEADGPS